MPTRREFTRDGEGSGNPPPRLRSYLPAIKILIFRMVIAAHIPMLIARRDQRLKEVASDRLANKREICCETLSTGAFWPEISVAAYS